MERWADDDAPVIVDDDGLRYPNVEAFVTEFVAPMYRRRAGKRWCPQWREHPEAMLRLDALWQAYEAMRGKAPDLSTWWLGHFDGTMTALLDDVFLACNAGHRDLGPLQVDP